MRIRPPRKAQHPTADSTTPRPWLLPMRDMPLVLQQHGITEAHVRPLAGLHLPDHSVRSWRTSPALAWCQPLVEWTRTPSALLALVFDIDTRRSLELLATASMSASDTAPTPNLVAYRKASGHAHAIYTRVPTRFVRKYTVTPVTPRGRSLLGCHEAVSGRSGTPGDLEAAELFRQKRALCLTG